MFAFFNLGCMELLILVGLVVGLGYLFRTRRLPHKALLVLALVGLGLLFGLLFRALIDEHPPPVARVLAFLGLLAVSFLFIWVMLRLFGSAMWGTRPAADSARTGAPLAARIGGLPIRAVLLSSLPLAVLAFLIGIAVWPPRQPGEMFAAMFAFSFCWTLFFALPFSLTVWLCRALFWSNCPPVSRLKDLLAERLPSDERARLAAHLELCPACQHRVEGLTAGQQSWPEMASKLSERQSAPEPALQKLMARLKEEKDPQATRDEPVLSVDLPLGFLSPTDKPGQLGRLERYDVLEEIGRGGMGVVLKAFDPTLHRVVAIKVLAPQLATSGVARKRFLREARAAAAVTHDHIVTIHAVDEANGLPYLVMQYIAGLSLQQRIDKDGPLDLAEILRIGMQTASGLAAAHAQGIVHRDIKPANILLEEGMQRVKITDFGLARAMDDASLTQSGFVAGSPLYMAPEQARGEGLDQRADLFSLGSVLYTTCTGRPPFRAPNTLAVLRRVSEESPRPIRETNPEVPEWLAGVVDKLMAKDPTERFQSAGEVVEVLGQGLAQLQHAAWVPPVHSSAPAGANANAGLPTSMTLCPSCGANLHVPERMVGSIVHCAECGKPFHVEEGSEVIQVARAVPSPLGPGFRPRKKSPARLFFACGAGLLFSLLLLILLSYRSAEYPPQPSVALPATAFWQSELHGLPPEATLFGSIDLKEFGSLTLEDAPTQAFLRLAVPGEMADRLTTETLGRIRIDGVALGYYEGPKAENPRVIVHLQGLALDGRKRVVEAIRQATAEKIQVSEKQFQGVSGKSALMSGGNLPFALGIYDDQHVFLARAMSRDATGATHRKVLEQLPWFDSSNGRWTSTNSLSGYNPPWIQDALAKASSDGCGIPIGEIPLGWRKILTDALGLRVCPSSIVCHLKKEGQGVTLSLTLNLDTPGTDRLLRDDLEKWRLQVIDSVQAKWPAVRKEPQALASLGQTLKTMQWQTDRGSVRTQVHVSAATWTALCAVLKRASE